MPVTATPGTPATPARVAPTQRLAQAGLLGTRVLDTTLGEALDRQVRIGIVGTGPLARRRLVAQSAAAHALLHGRDAHLVFHAVHGLLATMDAEAGATTLDGIDFATDEAGFYADQVAAGVESGAIRAHRGAHFRHAVADTIATWQPTASRDIPMSNYVRAVVRGDNARVQIAPKMTSTFFDLLHNPTGAGYPASWSATDSGNALLGVLAHEVRHAVTPATAGTWKTMSAPYMGHDVNWLEEGVTQALTFWPGALTRAGAAMGLPVDESTAADTWRKVASYMPPGSPYAELPPYPKFVDTVHGVLQLAGVDTTSAGAYATADALLERRSVRFVPGRLAAAIVAHHDLPAHAYEPVRRAIVDLHGDPTRLPHLQQLVARYAGRR